MRSKKTLLELLINDKYIEVAPVDKREVWINLSRVLVTAGQIPLPRILIHNINTIPRIGESFDVLSLFKDFLHEEDFQRLEEGYSRDSTFVRDISHVITEEKQYIEIHLAFCYDENDMEAAHFYNEKMNPKPELSASLDK
jgi:hypothetical protein